MAAWRLPDFNLAADVWHLFDKPASSDPTWLAIPCQKFMHQESAPEITPNNTQIALPTVWLRVPAMLELFEYSSVIPLTLRAIEFGIFECPRRADIVDPMLRYFYQPYFVEVQHQGFPNEYWAFACYQVDPNGSHWQQFSSTLPSS